MILFYILFYIYIIRLFYIFFLGTLSRFSYQWYENDIIIDHYNTYMMYFV